MDDKQLNKNIVKALRLRRQELFERIALINEQLDRFQPKAPIVQRTPQEINEQRVLDTLPLGPWYTDLEIAAKAGIRQHSIMKKTVASLLEQRRLEQRSIGGIIHYRRKPEELRLVVGEGKLV